MPSRRPLPKSQGLGATRGISYQSRVYYADLNAPPAGARFSIEWGLGGPITIGTLGQWVEFPQDAVEDEIRKRAGKANIRKAQEVSEKCSKVLEQAKGDVLSILQTALSLSDDPFLSKLIEDVGNIHALTSFEFIRLATPERVSSNDKDLISLTHSRSDLAHYLSFF